MLGRAAMTLALSMMVITPCAARDAVYPRHELWLGFGGAASLENSVFNVPDDIASTPDLAISFGYMVNLDARRAVGLHVYGGAEEMTSSALSPPSGSSSAPLELGTYNVGVRYRHSFATGALVPYAFVGASLASGIVSGGGLGDLYCNGFSACIGPGASVRLGRNFKLSAEGFGSFGAATWEREPLANSSGTKFNPSLVGGTLNLSLVWGTKSPTVQPTVEDSSLAPGAPIASRPTHGRRAGQILLMEAVIMAYSSAAYSDDKGMLPGITLASVLLGVAGGGADFKSPKSPWILFGGTLAIVTAEVVMANNGASQGTLFWTSTASWNAVIAAIGIAERRAARSD